MAPRDAGADRRSTCDHDDVAGGLAGPVGVRDRLAEPHDETVVLLETTHRLTDRHPERSSSDMPSLPCSPRTRAAMRALMSGMSGCQRSSPGARLRITLRPLFVYRIACLHNAFTSHPLHGRPGDASKRRALSRSTRETTSASARSSAPAPTSTERLCASFRS